MKHIFMYGAIDRFNYGDLLFPIIIEAEIKRQLPDQELSFSCYGNIESDLSTIGALPTYGLERLYSDIEEVDDAVVIVVGGEVLSCSWNAIHSHLGTNFNYLYDTISFVLRRFSSPINNLIARFILKGKTKYPFILPKTLNKYTIYNSVGGTTCPLDRRIQMLKDSSYISLRSQATHTRFKDEIDNLPLVPDSAILMSDFYSEGVLENIAKSVPAEKYIFLQMNGSYHKNQDCDDVIKVIDQFAQRNDFLVVLCPIGLAAKHDDLVGLERVDSILRCNHKLVATPTIWDIMSLIAHSKFYIGTSLHGIITAMSYSLPYIALSGVPKVTQYIETWGVEGLQEPGNKSNFHGKINQILNIPKVKMKESRNNQIGLVRKQFSKYVEIIKS